MTQMKAKRKIPGEAHLSYVAGRTVLAKFDQNNLTPSNRWRMRTFIASSNASSVNLPRWYTARIPAEFDIALLRPLHTDAEGKRRGFETPAEAANANRSAIKALRASRRTKDIELADKLENCSYKRPCTSPACRVCTRKYRRFVVAETMQRMLAPDSDESRLVTIVLSRYIGAWFDGPPRRWPKPERMGQALRVQVSRLGVPLKGIGCVEVDIRRESGDAEPHCHLVLQDLTSAQRKVLRRYYRKRSTRRGQKLLVVNRSVGVKGFADVASYPFKFIVNERQSYEVRDEVSDEASNEERTRRKSRKVRLRGRRRRAALRWLDRSRFEDFVVRFNGPRKGQERRLAAASRALSAANLSMDE